MSGGVNGWRQSSEAARAETLQSLLDTSILIVIAQRTLETDFRERTS
jgi:hypothetical protein